MRKERSPSGLDIERIMPGMLQVEKVPVLYLNVAETIEKNPDFTSSHLLIHR